MGDAGNLTLVQASELEEQEIYLALSLSLLVLTTGIFLTSLLRVYKVTWFAEASALIVLGMIVGSIMNAAESEKIVYGVERLISFDENLFFIVLLPPIIFDSALEIHQSTFFRNFGTICALAFLGTVLNAVVIALILYSSGQNALIYQTNFIESMTFGSLISATDPVTVIAVFQSLQVSPELVTLVLGESVLNDAVAIVLYNTVIAFQEDSETAGQFVLRGMGEFLRVFIGSLCVGVAVGVLSALICKYYQSLQKDSLRVVETAFVILLPYIAYCLAEGFQLSGIVSILFCGLAISRYTKYNLSSTSASHLDGMFSTLAYVSESFIFIYLGLAVFTGKQQVLWEEWGFGVMALFACLLSRMLTIIPMCLLANQCRSRRLSGREVFVVWAAGLRGGMAYALSASAKNDLINSTTGLVFQAATILVTLMTVFLFGNTMNAMAKCLSLSEDATIHAPLSRSPTSSAAAAPSTARSFFTRLEDAIIKPMLLRQQGPQIEGANGATHTKLNTQDSETTIELTPIDTSSEQQQPVATI